MRKKIIAAGLLALVIASVVHFVRSQSVTRADAPVAATREAPAIVLRSDEAPRRNTLEIWVREAGEPVPGARVVASLKSTASSALRPTWTDRIDVRTDASGQSRFQVRPGQWFVLVQKEGFADAVQDVVVETENQTTSVTVSLERGFTVSGVAVDSDGHALAPAFIEAIPLGDQLTKRKAAPEGSRSVSVETNGTFTLTRLSRGWWRLEGESEGFGRSQPRVISVPTTESVQLVFRPSGFIEGFVVKKDGSPAPHAAVFVVGENGSASVDASDTGAFSVERPQGAYRLSARLGDLVGSTPAPTFVRARATVATRLTLEGKGATLRGQVTRDDGVPVGGATILVRPTLHDGIVAEGRTHEDGRWELAGLAPGTVDLEASFGGMSPASETGFQLVDGAQVEVKLTLARLGSLEGTVIDADGQGVAAQVVLRGKYDQFPERQAIADTNGRFHFADLPSGDVVVQASLGVEDSGATAHARIQSGVATKVSLALAARYDLRVELDRSACRAIEGATLTGFEPDASHPAIATLVPSSTQHVVLKLRPGTWTLRAASGTPAACAGQAEVTLSAGSPSRTKSIHLVPMPPILQVMVLENTKDPAPGAQVSVLAKDGSQLRAETDLDGRAALALARETVAAVSAVKQGRSARLAIGSITGQLVSLTLSPAAHLRVHLVGHQSMTRVTVVASDGESMPVEARTTEADVSLAEVPEGVLDVRASNADDSRFGASTVTTRAGETAEVTLALAGVGFLVGSASLPPAAQGQARVAVTSGLGTVIEQLDPSGRFKLGPMPEDHYTVEVRCTGCTWAARSVQVNSSQETRVEFQ